MAYRFLVLAFVLILLPASLPGHLRDESFPDRAGADYDRRSGQIPVWEHSLLDSVLGSLKTIHGTKLPPDFVRYSRSDSFSDLLYQEYYLLQGEDIFRYVAGHFRLGDFVSKDSLYHRNMECQPEGCTLYWLCDKRVLHRFLDLLLWMRKNGFNDSALTVKNGHRHPAYNKTIGGAGRSYHMKGMAIDVRIGDINRNGTADAADKTVVLEALEKHIIGSSGGLGRYPGSDVIHFDTRGYRARWDSH